MTDAVASVRNLRAMVLVGGAGGAGWLMNFATLAILAHRLGSKAFGLFSFGLSVAVVLGAFIGPNLNVWGARVIARDHGAVGRTVLLVNGVQLAAGAVLFAVLAVAYRFLLPRETAAMLTVCNLGFLAAAFGTQWVVQGLQRLDLLALNQVIATGCGLILVLVVVHGPAQALAPAALLAAGQVAGSLFIIANLWRHHAAQTLTADWRAEFRALAKASVFLGFSVCGVVSQNAGLILTHLFGGDATSALYGVAARTYLTFLTAAAMLSTIFFPRVAARAGADEAANRREIQTWLALALAVGGGPASLMIGAPHLVIHQLFGDAYQGAAFAVRAAGAAILISFANNAYAMSRLARGGDRDYLRAILTAMVVAVAGGAAAGALFGLNGVAAILPCMELAILLTMMRPFRRDLGESFWRAWIRPLAAILVAVAFLLTPVMEGAPLVKLAVAATIYGLIVLPWGEARAMWRARRALVQP